MSYRSNYTAVIIGITAVFLLAACSGGDDPQPDADTKIAQSAAEGSENGLEVATVVKGDERSALLAETTPTPSRSILSQTRTAQPNQAPSEPTFTPTPVANETEPCTNESRFVEDVTFPDGSFIDPGESFEKIWRIRNEGTCTWDGSYRFVFVSGSLVGAEEILRLPARVAPGETVDIAVSMTAPEEQGPYKSTWELQAPDDSVITRPNVEVVVEDTLASLKQEIYFGAGGGFPNACRFDQVFPFVSDAVDYEPYFGLWRYRLCIADFPLEDEVRIQIWDAQDQLLSDHVVTLKHEDGDRWNMQEVDNWFRYYAGDRVLASGAVLNDRQLLEIPLWMAAGKVSGRWTIAIQGAQDSVIHHFEVEDYSEPVLSIIPAGASFDPLQQFGCEIHRPGQQIAVFGEGFTPGEKYPLGYYRFAEITEDNLGRWEVLDGQMVRANEKGRFASHIVIKPDFEPGRYVALIPAEAVGRSYHVGGPYGDTCFEVE